MTPSPTVRLRAYPALCAALLLAAVGLHRPELVAVAAPFGLIAAVGLARSVPPDVTARMAPTELRAIEGDGVTALVEIDSPRAQWQVDVGLAVPDGLATVGGPPRRALRPAPGTSVVPFDLACDRWGGFVVSGRIRVREPLGLRVWDAAHRDTAPGQGAPADRADQAGAPARPHAGLGRVGHEPHGGRGPRVRRRAALPARRPAATRQLEGERPARHPLLERPPPRAERRRRPLPRLVRRVAGVGRPGRPGGIGAGDRLPARPRPGRRRRLRRRPALGASVDRPRADLPRARLADRHRGGRRATRGATSR